MYKITKDEVLKQVGIVIVYLSLYIVLLRGDQRNRHVIVFS